MAGHTLFAAVAAVFICGASAWAPTSLLTIRVTDNTTCPATGVGTTCTRSAYLYLDEYNMNTGALVSSQYIQGATLSANDQYVGSLTRCGDGTCLTLGAQTVAPLVAPTTVAPFFPGDRVVVRITANEVVDLSTKIVQTDYNGLFKGVCSVDGTGYWVLGNATGQCVGYVAHGSTSGNFVKVTDGARCTTGNGVMHGRYTSCFVTSKPATRQIYFGRTHASYAFFDVPKGNVKQENWTTAGQLDILGTTTATLDQGFNNPNYMSQIAVNYDMTRWWGLEPHQCGIILCNGAASIPSMPRSTATLAPGCNYMYGGAATGPLCTVSGLALSPDESTLYLTARNTLYSLPALGGILTTVASLPARNEFRGVAIAPQVCSGTGTTPMAGFFCAAANAPLSPCLPGTFSAIGATTTCANCPDGFYSSTIGTATCTACPSGIGCLDGATNITTLCPAGFVCISGAAPVACAAGKYCPAGSTNPNVDCPAGYYCPAGVPPVGCPPGKFSTSIGQSLASTCQNCAAGKYSDLAATTTCSLCPAGTYNNIVGQTRSGCITCDPGYLCLDGATSNSDVCPAGWFCGGGSRPTGQCGSGTYSAAIGAQQNSTCLACSAGSWCPIGSTNSTTDCQPGWQCPGGGAINSICGPGFYAPGYRQTTCTKCVAGSLSNVYGATSCTICPAGTFSESGSDALVCSDCPANTFSPNPGAGSRAFCTPCPSGYSSQPKSTRCEAMTWSKLNPPFPLAARQGGVAVVNSTAVMAVGGRRVDGSLAALSLAFDYTTGGISESAASTASFDSAAVAPYPSDNSADDGTAYVFGGVDASGRETATLWKLNNGLAAVPSATQITFPLVPSPTARKLAGMAYITPCPSMAGACLVMMGGSRNGVLLEDVWVFDLTANVWSQPAGTNLNMPRARAGHAVTAAPNSSMLYVFGGTTTTGASNDQYVLAPFGFSNALPSEMVNVAVNKLASISALDPNQATRGAGAAVDGNIISRHNPVTGGNSATCNCNWCAMTPAGPVGTIAVQYGSTVGTTNPWWGLDLGSTQQVDYLYIYMRQPAAAGQYVYDFPFGKSAGAALFASNSNSTPASPCPSSAPYASGTTSCPYTSVGSGCPSGTTANALGGCTVNVNLGNGLAAGGPTVLRTEGLKARYLWLTLPGLYRILAICEFQAYQKKPWVWRTLSGTYNAALNGATVQSSTLSGYGDGQASRAVDGLLTNKLDNALPYTMSHTRDGGDTPLTFWRVDMGRRVDVQRINVYGRSDCCTNRNTGIKWYVGDSTDHRFNTLCVNSPADITPTKVLTTTTQCTTGPQVVTTVGAPATACYRTFTCPARGRYLMAVKDVGVASALQLGEVEAIANTLLDVPTARTGMAVSTFGGNMVLFGGSDASGFRNNEVRFFDMLGEKWLPPLDPIGTLPVARASSFFVQVPSPIAGVPSNKFALFGGTSNTDLLNDLNVLTMPQCAPFDRSLAVGGGSVTCYHRNTVCYVTCPSNNGWSSPNGNSPVVCQTDGSWRGFFPICTVDPPGQPLSVTATVDSNGIARVKWSAPVFAGYNVAPGAIDQYNVKIATNEIYESFGAGNFPAPIAPFNQAGAGRTYVGGNWYSMNPKMGPLGLTGVSSTATAATAQLGVSNTYDFWNGYLRLDSDFSRYPSYDQMNSMVLYRDWPAGLDPAGSWAVETFATLDTYNIVTAANQQACLAIVDVSDYAGTGAVEFYACIRNNGAQVYMVMQSSSRNAWTTDRLDTAPFNNAYSKPYAAYLRYEHLPAEYPFSFRAYWKLNQADAWIKFPTFASQLLMRGGPMNMANVRPALLMFNANTQLRGVALFSYFRVGPILCDNSGAQRFVSGSTLSTFVYGLSQNAKYTFSVTAKSAAGWGSSSAPSNQVTIPVVSVPDNLPLLSRGRPCRFSTSASNTGFQCGLAFDGDISTYAWTNAIADPQNAGSTGWLQVDIGTPRTVKFVRVVSSQTAGTQVRNNRFQIWVGNEAQFWLAKNQQCDPAYVPALISTVPGFAVTFPCFQIGSGGTIYLEGQYITLRRNPLITGTTSIAELEVFGSASTPLVSQNKPCTMQSTSGINTCAFALDGRFDTFALNNNNAPALSATTGARGWLTVDLGVATVISSIKLYAYGPMRATLDGFKVRVGELNPWYFNAYTQNMWCNQSYLPATFPSSNMTEFKCVVNDGLGWITNMPAMGRYVSILTVAGPAFAITELQVYSQNWVIASVNKPCKQSSALGGRLCTVGVNGVHSATGDYFATGSPVDLDNYATYDLGFSSAVRAFKLMGFPNEIYNRNFEIYVGDSPNYRSNTMCNPALIPRVFVASTQWTHAAACTLTGRYWTIRAPINYVVASELQVFVANACPNRYATGALQQGGSTCAGAGWGSVCTHTCNAGWTAVSGSTSSTCNGAAWDKPELVCAPTCADLAAPQYSATCRQTFFTETFNVNGALSRFVSLDPYLQMTGVPTDSPPQAAKWFQLDGRLQSSSVVACTADLNLVMASQKIYDWSSGFVLSAQISTQSRAGLVFRALDKTNLMRFWFDVITGTATVERVVNGIPLAINSATSNRFKTPDVFHSVSVSVFNGFINVTFDSDVIITTADRTFLVGYAGLYAQSQALFDDVAFSVDCTSCQGMTDGATCTFGCQDGLIAVGPLSRTCTGSVTPVYSPDVIVSPLVCTLAPPTFTPSTLFVLENSAKNANVGDPLVAFSTSPDYQVQFQILAVYEMAALNMTGFRSRVVDNQGLFWVDACSGQVKLRSGGVSVMDYEGVNQYDITVRVFVSGFAGAEVTRNITAYVLNVDEAPFAIATAVTMPENTAIALDNSALVYRSMNGFIAGVMGAWDPENSTLLYAVSVDGSFGKLSLNNYTGVMAVSSGVNATQFNFEHFKQLCYVRDSVSKE